MSCWACLMALITMMLCCVKRERGAGESVIVSSSSSSSWGPCEDTIERVSGQGFWWELTSQASFLFSFSLWPFLVFFYQTREACALPLTTTALEPRELPGQ